MRDYGSVSFLAAAEKRNNDFMKEQKKLLDAVAEKTHTNFDDLPFDDLKPVFDQFKVFHDVNYTLVWLEGSTDPGFADRHTVLFQEFAIVADNPRFDVDTSEFLHYLQDESGGFYNGAICLNHSDEVWKIMRLKKHQILKKTIDDETGEETGDWELNHPNETSVILNHINNEVSTPQVGDIVYDNDNEMCKVMKLLNGNQVELYKLNCQEMYGMQIHTNSIEQLKKYKYAYIWDTTDEFVDEEKYMGAPLVLRKVLPYLIKLQCELFSPYVDYYDDVEGVHSVDVLRTTDESFNEEYLLTRLGWIDTGDERTVIKFRRNTYTIFETSLIDVLTKKMKSIAKKHNRRNFR